MSARKKTRESLNRHLQESSVRHLRASMREVDPSFEGEVRVAGEVPKTDSGLDNEMGRGIKREIPQGYEYDPKALKPLAKMLWAMSVSLGHAMTAHRQFTKLKSSTVSPDGMIGGRGYVMAVKEIRKALYDACEGLSAVSDTIHDELHAPHWKPKLGELEKADVEGIERLVGDAERILDDPEGETSDDEPEDMAKAEKSGPKVDLEAGSEMPDGDDLADNQVPSKLDKQASGYTYRRASSLPVETMSGPRVEHLDRGDVDQTGPFGSYNVDEPQSMHDQWSRDQGVGNDYEFNETSEKGASSAVPDSNTDKTPTEGYDFGIGYGEGNDAHGQGAGGYSNTDEDGRGLYGPSTELPNDPGGKIHDNEVSDTTPSIEQAVSQSSMPKHAAWKVEAQAELPNDGEPPVARSDYYQGDKGSNMVNADSTLPGEPTNDYEFSNGDLPELSYTYERGNQPYIKWDSETHNMRPDPVYQREVEGPYVKQEG